MMAAWSPASKGSSQRYSTLGGSSLPLWHQPVTQPFASLQLFGPRQRITWRFMIAVFGFATVLVLVNVVLWCLLSAHDRAEAGLSQAERAARPGAGLVMLDEEALAAMYPPTADRVPRSHSGDPTSCEQRFTLLLVSDMDANTTHANGTWHSSLRRGSLCWRGATHAAPFSVSWVDEVPLVSALNSNGRGMELSELVWYGGRLLTCDDRTGVVYEVRGGAVRPAYILADGDGYADHTFKCEWAAVRHGLLYVGGLGRAWTDDRGALVADSPKWIKVLDGGAVRHLNWSRPYEAMREAAGCAEAGYLSHEAALWDDSSDRWLFMPRRASAAPWDEAADEERGANLMLWSGGGWGEWERHTDPQREGAWPQRHGASAAATPVRHPLGVRVARVEGPLSPRRGFSSVKLLPGTGTPGAAGTGLLVALKTEEHRGHMATYLSVLSTNGTVLMEDTYVANAKYEGIEVAV